MVRTTSQTFLGLTLGCARCHNHKFDPLTMVDYYSLAAILAPLKRPNKGRMDRDVPLGTPEQIAAINARNEELAKLDTENPASSLRKSRPDAERADRRAIRRAGSANCGPRRPTCRAPIAATKTARKRRRRYLLLSGRASNPGPLMQPRVPAVLTSCSSRTFPAAGASTQHAAPARRWPTGSPAPTTRSPPA